MQRLFDRYVASYRTKDAAGCASRFSAEAELYSPYAPPAIGKPAITAIHQEWVGEGGENKQLEVMNAESSGHIGWCLVRFSEGTTGSGTSLNVLQRQFNGAWLITHCSLNEGL